jgi:hypothetical protein
VLNGERSAFCKPLEIVFMTKHSRVQDVDANSELLEVPNDNQTPLRKSKQTQKSGISKTESKRRNPWDIFRMPMEIFTEVSVLVENVRTLQRRLV